MGRVKTMSEPSLSLEKRLYKRYRMRWSESDTGIIMRYLKEELGVSASKIRSMVEEAKKTIPKEVLEQVKNDIFEFHNLPITLVILDGKPIALIEVEAVLKELVGKKDIENTKSIARQ